jgi:hypothetical protein
VEEADRRAEEASARELARIRPTGDDVDEKWRMTFRLFSESHSIRASALNLWNDGSDWLKLRRAKANELIVQITMPKTLLREAARLGDERRGGTRSLAAATGRVGEEPGARRAGDQTSSALLCFAMVPNDPAAAANEAANAGLTFWTCA